MNATSAARLAASRLPVKPAAVRSAPRRLAALAVPALAAALAASAPARAAQIETGVGLNGTTLTYYARPDQSQCHADCARNPNCRGSTWIQAGTYNPRDAAMCYQLSAVTSRFAKAGHFTMLKTVSSAPAGQDVVFRPPHVNGITVDNCAVWGNNCGWGGAHQLCQAAGYAAARSFTLNRPGRTYVIGSRQVCEGPNCVGFAEVVCMPPGGTQAARPTPGAPPAAAPSPATAAPAVALTGHWQWTTRCPGVSEAGGLFGIGPVAADGSFSGGFENGNGSLQGRAQGDHVEFVRSLGSIQQRWSARLSGAGMSEGVVVRPTEGTGNCSFTAKPYRV